MEAEAAIRFWAALRLAGGYNTAVVTLGAALLGVAAGIVGSFAFLRGRALVSDALSHATLPGVVLAYLVGVAMGLETRSLALLLAGAAVTATLGVWMVHLIARHSRLGEDAAIGAVLSVTFGVGVVLLSFVQSLDAGGQAGLESFILGQTAAMRRHEAMLMGALAAVAITVATLLFKEFRLACFDPEFAQGQGWPIVRIDLAMLALIVLVTVAGLQTVGLVLIVALLVVPPVAARFWTDRLPRLLTLAGLFGGASAYVGASLSSAMPQVPAGGVTVLVAGAIFVVSLLLAPARGVLTGALRLHRQRRRLRSALRSAQEARP